MWNPLSKDKRAMASVNPQQMGFTVVMIIIVVILVGALIPTLTTTLADYAANETTIGPVLQTLVPILIGLGLLLAFVGVLLSRRGSA